MTYAYWYIFIVMLLPYVFAILAKVNHPEFDNRAPRDFLDNLVGWRKRSHWAQLNSYEMFAPFAISVIIAQQANAAQQTVDIIALVFLILRVLYGTFYIFNRSMLRTLTWFGSFFCVIALFLLAAQ